ncbi:MAG TPA: aspartate/glutamate racemase family protein [Acetobacteraceae bacterium]|nr:aspartate/glutamate racemase family protein [Acetobacteraceae bacterium]
MSEHQPARIWYQSFVDPSEQASYIDRLSGRLRKLAAPGTMVEVHGIAPPDRFFHPITEFRCAEATIRAAVDAERGGYDAFVVGHFQEPGLTECRGAVDIPVIGLGEATMLFACSLGRKIGLVTIDPVFIPWHEEQVSRHGLSQRVGGVAAIQADLPRFMRAFTDPDEYAKVREDFMQQVRPLLARAVRCADPRRRPAHAAVRAGSALPDRWRRRPGRNRSRDEGGRDGPVSASPHRRRSRPERALWPRARAGHRRFPCRIGSAQSPFLIGPARDAQA